MKRGRSLYRAGIVAALSLCAGSAFAGFSSPLFTPAPIPLSFGTLPLGTTSAPNTETYTVSGGSGGTGVLLNTIGASGDFAVAGGTCHAGSAVATPGSCTVLVTFTPTGNGARNGTLTVNCTSIVFVGGGGIFCNQITSTDVLVPLVGTGLTLTPVPALPASGVAILSGTLLLGAFLTLRRRRA